MARIDKISKEIKKEAAGIIASLKEVGYWTIILFTVFNIPVFNPNSNHLLFTALYLFKLPPFKILAK